MARILVTYATMAGSTREVAQAVGDTLAASGAQVDVLPVEAVSSLDGYAGVVLGAPMILGWHRAARGFLKQHRVALQHLPLAVFVLAMKLTRTGETSLSGIPIYVDDELSRPPLIESHPNFRERHARLANYVRPILRAIRPLKPVTVGVFGGRVEYGRLKWWAVLFALLVIQAPAGDRRNWSAIRAWAAGLPAAMALPATVQPPETPAALA